jgi:hypothetical protein
MTHLQDHSQQAPDNRDALSDDALSISENGNWRTRKKLGSRHPWWLSCLVMSLVSGGVVLLLIRLVLLGGWWRPIQIVGGSMAPTLYGAGYAIRCRDCGFSFRLGAEYSPSSGTVVCPNCGFVDESASLLQQCSGQRVVVDRWPLALRDPRCWEPIAYYEDETSQRQAVKRVVAGNAGQVTIRDGDLFLDGQVVQKDLAQLRTMRIPVYDDRFRPTLTPDLPPRWQCVMPETRWLTTPKGFAHSRGAGQDTSCVDWLYYNQWICWPYPSPPQPRIATTPIFDHYAYNHEVSRGALHSVSDIMVSFVAQVAGKGRLIVRLATGSDAWDCEWIAESGRWSLCRNQRTVASFDGNGTEPMQVEMAICDRRVLVALDGVTRLVHEMDAKVDRDMNSAATKDQELLYEESRRVGDGPAPVAIGAVSLAVEISQLRIDRDIHYLGPGGKSAWAASRPLKPGEWFVLGDNVPVSLDSRYGKMVKRSTMLGVVQPRGQWRITSW